MAVKQYPIILAALAVLATPAWADMIYVETTLDEFGTYNTTANNFTEIGLPGTVAIDGLAFNGGTLYAINTIAVNPPTSGPSLYTINTTTGVVTLDEQITGLSGGNNQNAYIASAPGGGTIYLLDSTNLYTVNPTTGAASLVGAVGVTFAVTGFYGLNFGPDGDLYGSYNGSLYRINTSTGAGTLVGSYQNGVQLSTLFEANGSLYGISTDQLYTINTSTGAATDTGVNTHSLNVGNFTAATELAATPEPGSLAAVALGLCLGARKLSRKLRRG